MTQCKEIAKQLKKMLSIYSIEEKESELLPEFTEPFRFQETLFQQCRNAADELSYLGSCLSCESGDFSDMFYGIYQGNRLHFASSATLDGGCNHVRFFGVSVTALACNDREFVEKRCHIVLAFVARQSHMIRFRICLWEYFTKMKR